MTRSAEPRAIPRRKVLLGAGALLSGATLAGRVVAESGDLPAEPPSVLLLLDGVQASHDPDQVEAILSEFTSRGISIGLVLNLDVLMGEGTSETPMMRRIVEIALSEAGLFELVVEVSAGEDLERYFQMRAATGLRRKLVDALSLGAEKGRSFPVVSLLDRAPLPWLDMAAQRAAGFRVLLRPDSSGLSGITFVGRGQMQVEGGINVSLSADAATMLPTNVIGAIAKGASPLVMLGLEDAGSARLEWAFGRARLLAEEILAASDRGELRVTRPMDQLLQAGPWSPTEVALVIEGAKAPEEAFALEEFMHALAQNAVPFTLLGDAGYGTLKFGATEICVTEWAKSDPPIRPLPSCVAGVMARGGERARAVPVILSDSVMPWPMNGLDEDGRLVLSMSREYPQSSLSSATPLVDQVICVTAHDVATVAQRMVLIGQIVTGVQQGQFRCHSVGGLAEHLVAPEPVLSRLWSLRQRRVTDPPHSRSLAATEIEQLRTDARLAWAFIERFTDPQTGLCAGTVQAGLAAHINPSATMWDLASQLQGIIAASRLGIIAQKEAVERAAVFLAHLPSARLDGLRLPPAMFGTDGSGIVRAGFDSCDTGRFLIALNHAVKAGIVGAAEAEAVFARWDLADTLRDGRAHKYTQQGWSDDTLSHCTPYQREGLRRWGLDALSPYRERATADSEADRAIATLYDVAAIGPFGAEPLLLEAVETGFSPESALLAEVLFDAQLGWFEKTGRLKCPSEGPLNFAPWFTFQGLAVDRLGAEAWVVSPDSAEPAHHTRAFQEKAEFLSAKSAFLWAAVRPHPFSTRLLSLMRSRARIENTGFSVGLFARDLSPMRDYTDLNTNGIILTAIAHMLA